MKQTLLFSVLLSFALTTLTAQITLDVSPNPFVETFTDVDLNDYYAEPIAYVTVLNKSQESIDLMWRREIVDAPAEWDFRVCDANQCYSSTVESNAPPVDIPVELAPNGSSIMDLHVLPRQVAGECTVFIYLSTFDDPDTYIDTIEYYVTITEPNSVSQVEKASLRVYPNPATDFVQVDNAHLVDELVFYNVVGREVRSFDVYQGGKYNIADLPDGLYLVSFLSNQEGILRTVRLSKRSMHP
jgi:hypothetical protein